MWTLAFLLAALTQAPVSNAKSPCPIYGALLPRPTNLLQQQAIQVAALALDDVFAKYVDNANNTGSDAFSYSVEVFSGAEDKPLWTHYWTAPNLKSLNSTGVKKVNGNSVYRIGSITKIFTMVTFFATVGDSVLNDPITKHLPEIAELARNETGNDPIFEPDWDDITLGMLATQTSGLIRDYAVLGELSYQIELDDLYKMGFPPLPITDYPPCGVNPPCDREQLYAGLGKLPPSYLPGAATTYSDLNFVLLSFVAERITGKPFETLVRETILEPLNLTHTYYEKPDDSVGVIPGTPSSTKWMYGLGNESATGNMYTSSTDLSVFGRAILRSTLLKPALTRRWMKPYSFTSDPKALVGMPWGVRRIDLTQNSSYQFVHTYNKAGGLGSYTSLFAIIPELNLGYSVLVAGEAPGGLTLALAEGLTSTYVPTLMYVMRDQANRTYAGDYRFTGVYNGSIAQPAGNGSNTKPGAAARFWKRFDNSSITTLNSSLTIKVNESLPGMGVYNWFSNGTDMSYIATAVSSNISSDYFQYMQPSVRIYPTGLEQSTPDGGKRVAFKAVFEDLNSPEANGTFTSDCSTWVSNTAAVYASRPLDTFIFNFDAHGKVTGVENAALRLTLDKVS